MKDQVHLAGKAGAQERLVALARYELCSLTPLELYSSLRPARPLQLLRRVAVISSRHTGGNRSMDESTNPGAGAGAETEETAGEGGRFSKARDYTRQKYESASDKVRDGYQNVRGRVEEVDYAALTDQARAYVRSNPGKALLISVGVGFLLGLLLRRDED